VTYGRALRCSDVPNPEGCLKELEAVGLVEVLDGVVRVVEIRNHIMSPSRAEHDRKAKDRMRRLRAHRAGDHYWCGAEDCPSVMPVPGNVPNDVPSNYGSGRVGSGNPPLREPTTGFEDDDDSWPDEESA
jgi:hypothetical protein